MILTFITAPDIPPAEVTALESHYLEAMNDPEYVVVLNYPVLISEVEVDEDATLVVSSSLSDTFREYYPDRKKADELTDAEAAYLEKKVAAALKGEKKGLVVTNYDLDITTYKREEGDKLVVIVDGGQPNDVMQMREKLDRGEKLIVSPFPVVISLIPPQEQK